jgi:hypothetical protein
MKLLQLNIVFFLCVVLAQGQSRPPEKAQIAIDFQELKLIIADIKPGDYETTVRGDSAVVKSRLYEAIDGKSVHIENKGANNLTARISFEVGILQYYNDDVRASPLDFLYKTGWTPIAVTTNAIRLPQYSDNYENVVKIHEHLGYADRGAFERFLETSFFQKIKDESYSRQKRFYEWVLKERRSDYEKCCPEYIVQANEFLARKPSDFGKLDDLAIEIYVPKLVLEISGESSSGAKFAYKLMGLQ